MFSLFLSVALLFTLGFPAPFFSQAMQIAEQPISFEEVEGFIQQAYQLRTRAITNPDDLSRLELLYSPNAQELWQYEKARAEFWRHWADKYGQLLSFTSTVSLIPGSLSQNNSIIILQAKEILTISWKPNIEAFTAGPLKHWQEKLAQAKNEAERKEAIEAIDELKAFPQIVNSKVGSTHLLTLVYADSGLQIIKDGYSEVSKGGEFPASPDFLSISLPGKAQPSPPRVPSSTAVSLWPMWYTLCTYYRGDAVNYARQYANNYNPYYRDFSNEGGDCANFCSQAIYAGNQVMVWPYMYGTSWWYDHRGTYDPSDDTYSSNWNNTYNLDFLTDQTRASITDGDQNAAGNLLAGDLVDWWHHTHEVIVDTPGTPPLVDGHTDDWLQHPLPVGSYHLYHLYDQYYVGGP